MSRFLHIVSFDVPFPANYGGVIDVYYKLAWLKKSGVKVYLHCFSYGREPAPELNALCEKVYYYPRKTGFISNMSLLPYNVRSRMSFELEHNLLNDDYPILFEVLHTCYLLNDKRFKERKKIYRHSNIEHVYYNELSKSERNVFKKVYLKVEAFKLSRFERILQFADLILSVNQKDTEYFKHNYPSVESLYLPSFHPNNEWKIGKTKGEFILFHGNLSVSENYEAAEWLVKEVFSNLHFKCVIAGLNPPDFLVKLAKDYDHISLVANPSETEMISLVSEAQIHLLYTAQPTGLKLKLLNVLFGGRFVICNSNMLEGTGIVSSGSVVVCDTPAAFIKQAKELMQKDFTENLVAERKIQVSVFDNELNCKRLIETVFNNPKTTSV